ncbi:hypothetical protein ACHAXA_008593 [Cyclostephanos tholiformis]|uniref:Protein-S-isoprenylcysteine O-methyltransferase n=1 Tax=Cyclostephanos tholiformis TaxID=382380 RepID=A0ABD3SP67_9STRA
MPHIRLLSLVGDRLSSIQSILAFERWKGYPQFDNDGGFGRVALLACVLGSILGAHVVLFSQLLVVHLRWLPKQVFGDYWSDETLHMAMQWTVYVIALCAFHLAEFFATAVFNPSATSADSFMVNHSKAYTAAAMISCAEFWVRAFSFRGCNSPRIYHWGILFVLFGQLCRLGAMITCGECFNHYIQRDRKENHVLVTHGIYGIFRHPSYVGFYYWALGTQLVLCNPISTVLYGMAAWTFFRYRIAYEEETLRKLFPGGVYESYAARTYIGIPFIRLALRFDDKNR